MNTNQLLKDISINGIYKNNTTYKTLVLFNINKEKKLLYKDSKNNGNNIARLLLLKSILRVILEDDSFTLSYIKDFKKLYNISNNLYKMLLKVNRNFDNTIECQKDRLLIQYFLNLIAI